MNRTISVAVVGASGYTGEEIVKSCLRHPAIEVTAVTSRQFAGKTIGQLLGYKGKQDDLTLQNLSASEIVGRCQAAFLALPHGLAAEYAIPLLDAGVTVFDLSADFRIKDQARYQEYYHAAHPAPHLLEKAVYGMPELHRNEIREASLIACPGCYPTSTILPLAPLLRSGLIGSSDIIVNSLSGVSGAGKKAELAYSYCECNENLRAYGIPRHRHIPEIEQELSLQASRSVTITFIPHLVPVTRGILTTIVTPLNATTMETLTQAYQQAYQGEPFVRVLPLGEQPETRRVAPGHTCEIGYCADTRTDRLILTSAIDNLGKGASSQAVQAFNVRFNLPETTGLLS